MTPSSSTGAVVIDANVFIALGAREQAKLAVAETALADYAARGWLFYAPGVVIADHQGYTHACSRDCRDLAPWHTRGRDSEKSAAFNARTVFSALSYYSDHQDEINEYIRRNRIPDELIDPLV